MTLYEMKEIEHEAGRKEGLQEGKKEGRANELIDLVCDGTITEEAALIIDWKIARGNSCGF